MSFASDKRAWFRETIYQGCKRYGGSELSGIRSTQRNADVRGHPNSRHLVGLAVDLVFDSPHQGELAYKWFYKQGLHGYLRKNKRYMHIQDRAAKPPAQKTS